VRSRRFQLSTITGTSPEVVDEVLKEVADARIVAVAQDSLIPEMLPVVNQLFFDVGKLGVKFVLLGGLGGMEASIQRIFCRECHLRPDSSGNYVVIDIDLARRAGLSPIPRS
jgi:hypothetical protein